MEQPQTGTHALHAVAACAVPELARAPPHVIATVHILM